MGRYFLVIVFILQIMSSCSYALDIDKSLLRGYDTAFVLFDRSTGELLNYSPQRSSKRFPPCSTFKIYNTLIGLELGLIHSADEIWYKWDGVQRDFPEWNSDLTLREAFRVSCVPAYQLLARQIGSVRMSKFIDTIGYGNRNISSGVDVFWLTSQKNGEPIMISVDEQVTLMNALLDGRLLFSENNVSVLRDIMRTDMQGKGVIYGKTGSGIGPDGKYNLGWYVGFVESAGKTFVFACNIVGGEAPNGKVAREIVVNILKNMGLF